MVPPHTLLAPKVQVPYPPAWKALKDQHLAQANWAGKCVLAWDHVQKANTAKKYLWPQRASIPLKADNLQFKVWSIYCSFQGNIANTVAYKNF